MNKGICLYVDTKVPVFFILNCIKLNIGKVEHSNRKDYNVIPLYTYPLRIPLRLLQEILRFLLINGVEDPLYYTVKIMILVRVLL